MNRRILLVDDNTDHTTLLSRTLGMQGFDTAVENDAVHAFNTVQRVQPDLILLDLVMPGKDGEEVLMELQSDILMSQIPVILLTGIVEEGKRISEALGYECPVMGKPVEVCALHRRISTVLGRS